MWGDHRAVEGSEAYQEPPSLLKTPCCRFLSPVQELETPNVHHNNYDRYGDELLSDLVALCEECHGHYHGEALQDAS
jgi:hypothetical protein